MIFIFIFISASEDYIVSSFSVTFSPDSSSNGSICSNISITVDNIVEDMEEFTVLINSSDSSVLIVQPNAAVIIVDSNGKKYCNNFFMSDIIFFGTTLKISMLIFSLYLNLKIAVHFMS